MGLAYDFKNKNRVRSFCGTTIIFLSPISLHAFNLKLLIYLFEFISNDGEIQMTLFDRYEKNGPISGLILVLLKNRFEVAGFFYICCRYPRTLKHAADPYHKMLIYRLGRSVSAVCNFTYHMTFARLYFDVLFLSPRDEIKR